VRDASSLSHEVEASFELGAAGERENAIQPVGRELSELIDGFRVSRVDDVMRAEPAGEARRHGARSGGNDVSAALNGDLNGYCADGARRAEDQDGLPRPQLEFVYSLECRQPGRGHRSRVAQLKRLRHSAHVLSGRDSEFRIEATLAIAELVRVDTIGNSNAPDSRTFGDDDSCAVDSGHQWESCPPGLSP